MTTKPSNSRHFSRQRAAGFTLVEAIATMTIVATIMAVVSRVVLVSVDAYAAPNNVVANDCPGSANSFAQHLQYADASGLSFAYGTDLDAREAITPRRAAGVVPVARFFALAAVRGSVSARCRGLSPPCSRS